MSKFQDLKPKIIAALNEKTPNLKCNICGNKELTLIDGFFNHSIQTEMTGSIRIGGPVIPTIGIICIKCGHLMEFSVGALGLLPKENNEKK